MQSAIAAKKPRRPAPGQSALKLLDWDAHRDHIEKLYIDESKSLEDTRAIMSSQLGFVAS